jgi:hypothetical protein
MDRDNYADPVLRMFCNWVVHTDLGNKAEGSTLILREFDKLMADLHDRKLLSLDRGHISLGSFRESLERCFAHFGLTAPFVGSLAGWKQFFTLYAAIVSECPIVFTASKIPLRYIQKVELRGVSKGIPLKEWPILHWELTLQDGTVHHWGFHLG